MADVVALVALQLGVSLVGVIALTLLGTGEPSGFAMVGILIGAQGWAGIKEKRAPGTLVAPFRARLSLLAAATHTVLGGAYLLVLFALGEMADVSAGTKAAIFAFSALFAFAIGYGITRWGLRMGTPKALR